MSTTGASLTQPYVTVGPYVNNWGLSDATQPLRYGGEAEELGYQLSSCAMRGNVSGARALLAQGACANLHDAVHVSNTPLHRAALVDHQEILAMLLGANASVHEVRTRSSVRQPRASAPQITDPEPWNP